MEQLCMARRNAVVSIQVSDSGDCEYPSYRRDMRMMASKLSRCKRQAETGGQKRNQEMGKARR